MLFVNQFLISINYSSEEHSSQPHYLVLLSCSCGFMSGQLCAIHAVAHGIVFLQENLHESSVSAPILILELGQGFRHF